jgi:hypothetical protein
VQPEAMAASEGATPTTQTGKAIANVLPTACDCIVTFRTVNSKIRWFNSRNLCQGLNGTAFQPAKGNQSFHSDLKTTKVTLPNLAYSFCDPRTDFLDGSGRSKFGAVECGHSNVTALSEP